MVKRQYSDETKAQVMAALLAGQAISQAAKDYGVPEGTIKSWVARGNRPQLQPDATVKKEIGALILSYLKALLETLQAQTVVFRDETWLRKQAASEAAVLHGVLADKGIRLLEGLAEEPENGESPTV